MRELAMMAPPASLTFLREYELDQVLGFLSAQMGTPCLQYEYRTLSSPRVFISTTTALREPTKSRSRQGDP